LPYGRCCSIFIHHKATLPQSRFCHSSLTQSLPDLFQSGYIEIIHPICHSHTNHILFANRTYWLIQNTEYIPTLFFTDNTCLLLFAWIHVTRPPLSSIPSIFIIPNLPIKIQVVSFTSI
jgi:hypothetical protein